MSPELLRRVAASGTAALLTAAIAAGPAHAAPHPAAGAGVLRFTVTTATGTPTGGEVQVYENGFDEFWVAEGELDTEGRLDLTVPAGDYQVRIVPLSSESPDELDRARAQWWRGKVSPRAADVVTVAPDATVEVAERLLVTGSVRLTARDAVTGAPLADFCAAAASWLRQACSEGSGTVTLTGLLPGRQQVDVHTEDGNYLNTEVEVAVVSDATVTASVDLVPGAKIQTSIVDATTGAAVPNACVALAAAGTGRLPDGPSDCSDDTGVLTIGLLHAGSYQLFVQPPEGSNLGAQWVGKHGGTGDPARARVAQVAAGETVTVPPVRLDHAGTIAGVVTSAATGQPAQSAYVSLSAWGRAGPSFGTDADEQGRYRLDRLGPYQWRLLFTTGDHARQWSGGTADRRHARWIPVRPGQVTTFSPALRVGTVLTGSVTDSSGRPLTVDMDMYHAGTGDVMGGGWSPDGSYRSLVLGPQTVKISWYWFDQTAGESHTGWYDGAQSIDDATPVRVAPGGSQTLDLVIDTN